MSKISKITVKHFLNERLKPEIEKGVEKYPVFCMILFNRHTIIKKSITHIRLTKNEFESKKYLGKHKRQIDLSLKYEVDLLTRIIEVFAVAKEKNSLSNNYLNFDSRFAYKSKNNELNQLNSYLNYFVTNINEVVEGYVYDENIKIEFSNKLEKTFDFSNSIHLKSQIINVLNEAEIFASDWSNDENNIFLKNNLTEHSRSLLFLSFCLEQIERYYETKITGYWCIPIFEWQYNLEEVSKNYKNYILTNPDILEFANKIDVKFNQNTIEKHLEILKKLTLDSLFSIKKRG